MGKRSRKQPKAARPPNKTHSRRDDPSEEEDMDDEIDAFHKQRDVIPLDVNVDAGDSNDDMEHPVFDMEGVEDDDSDNDISIDDDDDDDDDFDDSDGDREIAKMARQAKYLEQIGGGGDEMNDDAELEEEKKAGWGGRKGSYYNADNADYELQSSDEDLLEEEEAEVVNIQREKAKSLTMEDFGLEDADQDESDSDGQEKTFQDILVGRKATAKPNVDGVLEGSPFESYEEIKKDLDALSKEEQMDVVFSSAPELVGLLSELNEALNQLQKMKPLLLKVRERKDIAKGGTHYLEVKHILLLTYCQAIGFYLLLKSEGHPVRDHPVIARLVEIKSLLEKMKQIDVNLPSQIEEFVDPVSDSRNKPIRESVPLELKADTTKVNEADQLVNNSKNSDTKVSSQKDQDVQVGLQSMEMLKVRSSLEAKLKQKGIYHLTNPKPERTQNHARTPVDQRLETLDDFDDEVQQTALRRGIVNRPPSLLHPSKLSQLVVTKVNKPKFVSGDDDLPKRDDIGERRRKHELRVLARAGAKSVDDDDDDDDDGVGDQDGGLGTKSMDVDYQEDDEPLVSEDEFYKEVKKQRAEKLKAKEELYSRTPVVPQSLETEADGKRQITYQMEKNRGLTRPRKKLTKIPRKKYKLKHQKAVIRRKGQVRDIRKPSGPYGGEFSGINTSISRSIRFKS